MKLKRALLPIFIFLISLATLFCFTACDNGDGTHTHSYEKTVVAPTCTEQGYNLYVCSCEYSYRDTFVDALGHDFVEYTSNNDATYEKDGTKTAICERIGCAAADTITDEGSKLIEGHTHSYSSIITPPTCTERGYTTHTCDCNHSYIDTYVDTSEHSFTNYVSNGDATYEADGTKTAFCDYGCGTSKKIVDEGSKLERLTIQFVADDTIISTQTFDSTNKDIVAPACPTKNGFIGKWESFTLGDKSIVVNALYIEKKAWDGTSVASSFWDGDGSEERPYTIATAAHLKYLAKTVNEGNSYEGKYFKLCGDIDLGGHEWEPIGYCNYDNKYVFCGYFDGSDFSIRNYKITSAHNRFYFDEEARVYIGLFGYIRNASISNVNIDNFDVNIAESYLPMNYLVNVGGLTGLAETSVIENCMVNGGVNISVSGYSVSGSSHTCRLYIGGIVGRSSSNIKNVKVSGSYQGETQYVYIGGICSFASEDIASASFNGTIKAMANDMGYAGGIAAYAVGSIAQSNVIANIYSYGKYDAYCGGITGIQSGATTIGCAATTKLFTNRSPGTAYLGGISGYLEESTAKVDNCFSSVIIDIDSTLNYLDFYAGGLVGYIEDGDVVNSIASGSISIVTSYENAYAFAGGVAGFVKGSSMADKVTIENCVIDLSLTATNGTSIDVAKIYLADYCSIKNIKNKTEMQSKSDYEALGFKEYSSNAAEQSQNKCLWLWDDDSQSLYLNFKDNAPTEFTINIYFENLNGEYVLGESKTIDAISGIFAFPKAEEYEGFVSPTEAVVLVAKDGSTIVEYKYPRKTYTIFLEGNGGNGGYIYPKYQETLNLATLSTREGYTFGGWFFDAELTEVADINNISYVEGETLTLYAWWKEENKPSDFSYSAPSGVWINKYIGTDRTVVIPAYIGGVAVNQINSYAFKDNANLVSLVIPDTVTTINASILQGCTNITSLTIPFVGKNNRTQYSYLDTNYILGYFFEIQQVRYDQTPPEGWTKQGTTIKSMYEYGVYSNIPASLSSIAITGDADIPAHAFYNCKNIKSFILNEDITIIGEYAFYNSGLTGTFYLPKLVAICEYAFENTNLSYIHLPISVTEIGMYAISSYYNSLVVSCEASAAQPYWNSNWYYGTVNVYWGVTENPSDFSFVYTENGYVVEKYNGNAAIVIVPSIFNDGTNGEHSVVGISDYAFYQKNIIAVILPNSITSVGAGAFKECSTLVAVVLNNGLISIGNNAFRDCSALQGVVIPSTVEIIGERAFQDAGIKNLKILSNSADMGAWVFYSCNDLKNVTIADGTQRIYHGQFEGCDAIETIVLPDTITVLGSDAFMSCKNLKTIYIPKALTTISDWAFYGCPNVLIVEYDGAAADWRNIVIGTNNDILYSCTINYYNA